MNDHAENLEVLIMGRFVPHTIDISPSSIVHRPRKATGLFQPRYGVTSHRQQRSCIIHRAVQYSTVP